MYGYYGGMSKNEHGHVIATTEAEAQRSCAWCERMDTVRDARGTCADGNGCNTHHADERSF
jgi:hypothetical protein